MYFRGVNRGMAFTKPGFYWTGLVFLFGLLATGSGSNALFLALGFGLGALVVSSTLSEKVMHRCGVAHMEPAEFEAGAPAVLRVVVQNQTREWTCYGLEVRGDFKAPRYRLLPTVWKSAFSGGLFSLAPSSTAVVPLQMPAGAQLKRGHTQQIFLTLTTLYPFNLVRKYRVDPTAIDLRVLPSLDAAFLKELGIDDHQRQSLEPKEFHSHRSWQMGDPARLVDWRKSAALPMEAWTVKVYRDVKEMSGVVVVPHWESLASCPSETEWESFLSRVYTATRFCEASGRVWYLQSPEGGYALPDLARLLLCRYPAFAERARPRSLPTGGLTELPVDCVRLEIDARTFRWGASEPTAGRLS